MVEHSVTKEFSFDAAHNLGNGYVGKCSNLHGHLYVFEVTVTGSQLDQFGFVIDFGELKKVWKELEPSYDHQYLNESLGIQTTAENISARLFDEFSQRINTDKLKVTKLRLYETPTSFAEIKI